MRISTNMFQSQGIGSIQKHQSELMDIQEKMSSGKRVNGPGDDPVAITQIHSLNRIMDTIDQYAKNGDYAQIQLVQEETAINDTVESVQRARELAIQMMNDTYNSADRQAAAEEVGQIVKQVFNMMNYTNSDGEKLFAGSNVDAELAFVEDPNNPGYYAYIGSTNAIGQVDSAGNPVYEPLANYGSRFVQISFDADNKLDPDDLGDPSRVRVTDNGDKVFQVPGATTPFTYNTGTGTPDSNLLNVLVELQNALAAGDSPPDEVVSDMDASIGQLTRVRAEIGGRQNRIESQYDAGEAFKLALEERRSKLEDMDVVEGITDLTKNENALQMAQQIFTRVQGLSLFEYLR
ncbi:flagellar hook-associated protein FlgL [Thiomicrorhabdus sp. zzn3]|uniref:flagellar hook-associated protein FlgL n=1 Tax=Thiomicrorhabdus sp. zzn3 TaxID=3039775 RepID=UPI00243643D5|nr:flagellar hook-associated protein FlgL [Thiomicrorhabdus sp. zzn3]MDG6777604.1 flagellar hook-associated protein FlgL [Thiomicrorhabdus sp. zzn3]